MRVLLDTTYARRAPYSGTAVYLDRLQDAMAQVPGVELIEVANERHGRTGPRRGPPAR